MNPCALVLLAWLRDGKPSLESQLLGIALAMALLPEEIPVVFTIFSAICAMTILKELQHLA
jgi:P-type Ca2+ transporter type 2C